ncbi:MAG: hypothetical protein MUE54_06850 [Anaerolineae bacterium]|jgi:hypothetical protein|nr:hypothetical protein [Anaerolineae bacterium]
MSEIRTAPKYTWLRRPSFFITIGALAYCLLVIFIQNGDPLALVTLGTRATEGIPAEMGGTEGYDGQFVYFIARDPFSAPFYITQADDIPAYRFQRILLPALGGVMAFGNESLIPFTLLMVNLVALWAGGMLMESLLVGFGVSRWYVLGYALTIAIFGTVRLSLPEVLAYGLVLGGIFAMTYDKWFLGAGLFALAILSKETSAVFVAGYALWMLTQRQFGRVFWFSLISITPFLFLQMALYQMFGMFGVGSGGAMATSFEIIPFGGVIQIGTSVIQAVTDALAQPDANVMSILIRGGAGLLIFVIILGIFVIIPTVWGLKRAWLDFRQKTWDIWTILLGINALVMVFVPFSTYREFLGILRFIGGLQIAVILYSAQRKNKRALRNSTIWIFTLLLLVGSDLAGGTPS